ncbi:putative Ras GTPase-activating protein-binding protein [Helianthus debilis subsp. tardiflorus]
MFKHALQCWGCLYSAVLSYTAPVTGVVHRFYQDFSKLGQPEEDGSMSITTTMDAINTKILSLNYGDLKAEINSVDAQESLNGRVSVLVTGYMNGMDNIQQQFTQSFFLAPQDKGYFVLNDMFRYMNIDNHHDEDHAPIEDVVASATPDQGDTFDEFMLVIILELVLVYSVLIF